MFSIEAGVKQFSVEKALQIKLEVLKVCLWQSEHQKVLFKLKQKMLKIKMVEIPTICSSS